MKKFVITTLGCKVNRYESEAISEQLQDKAWHLQTGSDAKADLCIVNTCAVTQKAAMQSRQAVRRAISSHPGAVVLVTGCYAQLAPEVFTSMPGVHHVIGNTFKKKIAHLVTANSGRGPAEALVDDILTCHRFQDLPITGFGDRTRPFVKIQDGCDAFCAYCVIPHVRGPSRSLSPEHVIERIRGLGKSGYSEVVLCGINLGRYGQDLNPKTSLCSLMELVDRGKEVRRLRLSSIEPAEVSEDLIRHLATSHRACPHLHIPLQSGDDDVLKQMNRPYGCKSYKELIHHIVSVMPDVAIGVDVLVGFPGETDRAFENTCRLVEQLPIAYLHVFPFSKREGTPAASLEHLVAPETIKNRSRFLRDIGNRKRQRFYERFIGCTLEVLIEGSRDRTSRYLRGLTRNYIPVLMKGTDELFNQLTQARLTKRKGGKVIGELISTPTVLISTS